LILQICKLQRKVFFFVLVVKMEHNSWEIDGKGMM
jgi:hypothetical protein